MALGTCSFWRAGLGLSLRRRPGWDAGQGGMQAEPHVHETTRQKERLLDEAQGCQRAKGGLRTTSPLENDQSEGQEAKGADSLWPTVKCHQEVRASLKRPSSPAPFADGAVVTRSQS